jgi:hypothetical protein
MKSLFSEKECKSKEENVTAMIDYHNHCNQAFKVIQSDKSQMCVRILRVCGSICFFIVIQKSAKFIPHSCSLSLVDTSHIANWHTRAKSLVGHSDVWELCDVDGRDITSIDIQNKLEWAGVRTTCKNCFNAHKALRKEFFGDAFFQFWCFPSYVDALKWTRLQSLKFVDEWLYF